MSRPLPQSEPADLARTMRENCARMLEDAAEAGLLAPICLLIARAIAALFGRLANLAELWQAGLLPPLPPVAPRAHAPHAPRAARRSRHAHPNRGRRARPITPVLRLIVRRGFAPPRNVVGHTPAQPVSRPVERYPKS